MKHNMQNWRRSVCRSKAPGRQGRGSRVEGTEFRPSPPAPPPLDAGLPARRPVRRSSERRRKPRRRRVDCGPASVAQVYPLKWPCERESAEKCGKARKKINKSSPAIRQTKRTPQPPQPIMSNCEQLSANITSRAPSTGYWIQKCLPRRSAPQAGLPADASAVAPTEGGSLGAGGCIGSPLKPN